MGGYSHEIDRTGSAWEEAAKNPLPFQNSFFQQSKSASKSAPSKKPEAQVPTRFDAENATARELEERISRYFDTERDKDLRSLSEWNKDTNFSSGPVSISSSGGAITFRYEGKLVCTITIHGRDKSQKVGVRIENDRVLDAARAFSEFGKAVNGNTGNKGKELSLVVHNAQQALEMNRPVLLDRIAEELKTKNEVLLEKIQRYYEISASKNQVDATSLAQQYLIPMLNQHKAVDSLRRQYFYLLTEDKKDTGKIDKDFATLYKTEEAKTYADGTNYAQMTSVAGIDMARLGTDYTAAGNISRCLILYSTLHSYIEQARRADYRNAHGIRATF